MRFAALDSFKNRNFTYFFTGQVLSNTGAWFQNLALSLVILQATGSAQALSWVTAAQFAPLLLFAVPAGRLADRLRPRTILLVCSLASAGIVSALALATTAESPPLLVFYALIATLGLVSAFERVSSQAIIFELVGREGLTRAVSLSTITFAAARSIGPGLSGIAFQALGPTACMLVNAGSFLLVFVSLLLVRPNRLHLRGDQPGPNPAERVTLHRDRQFLTIMAVNVVIALLALSLMLTLTATATLDFGADPIAVGATHALNAVGAIVGGVFAAGRMRVSDRSLIGATIALGGGLLLSALSPTLTVFLAVAPLLGLGVGYYHGILNAAAQASVRPADLGRAMSVVTMGNYGMVPFGALLMGVIIDTGSGRAALLVGCAAAFLAAGFVAWRTRAATPQKGL